MLPYLHNDANKVAPSSFVSFSRRPKSSAVDTIRYHRYCPSLMCLSFVVKKHDGSGDGTVSILEESKDERFFSFSSTRE